MHQKLNQLHQQRNQLHQQRDGHGAQLGRHVDRVGHPLRYSWPLKSSALSRRERGRSLRAGTMQPGYMFNDGSSRIGQLTVRCRWACSYTAATAPLV
jgi:hypothetical protein